MSEPIPLRGVHLQVIAAGSLLRVSHWCKNQVWYVCVCVSACVCVCGKSRVKAHLYRDSYDDVVTNNSRGFYEFPRISGKSQSQAAFGIYRRYLVQLIYTEMLGLILTINSDLCNNQVSL